MVAIHLPDRDPCDAERVLLPSFLSESTESDRWRTGSCVGTSDSFLGSGGGGGGTSSLTADFAAPFSAIRSLIFLAICAVSSSSVLGGAAEGANGFATGVGAAAAFCCCTRTGAGTGSSPGSASVSVSPGPSTCKSSSACS